MTSWVPTNKKMQPQMLNLGGISLRPMANGAGQNKRGQSAQTRGKSAKIANFLKNQQRIKNALNIQQSNSEYTRVDQTNSIHIEGQINSKIKDLENRYRMHSNQNYQSQVVNLKHLQGQQMTSQSQSQPRSYFSDQMQLSNYGGDQVLRESNQDLFTVSTGAQPYQTNPNQFVPDMLNHVSNGMNTGNANQAYMRIHQNYQQQQQNDQQIPIGNFPIGAQELTQFDQPSPSFPELQGVQQVPLGAMVTNYATMNTQSEPNVSTALAAQPAQPNPYEQDNSMNIGASGIQPYDTNMQMIPEVSISKESTMLQNPYKPDNGADNGHLSSGGGEIGSQGQDTARRGPGSVEFGNNSNNGDESISFQGVQQEFESPIQAQVQDEAGMVDDYDDGRGTDARSVGYKSVKLMGSNYIPTKSYVHISDQHETVKREIIDLIDNFERTFVSYINSNFGTFTEKDVQRMISDELKQQIKLKLKDLGPGEMYQRCDPFKIEEIQANAQVIKSTNNFIRQSLQQAGTSIQKLAKTSLSLKNDGRFHDALTSYLQDLGNSITELNQLNHDVNFKVLQNDDKLGQIQVSCTSSLSSQGFLKKYQQLEQMYDTLQMQHTQVKQQLFQQTEEYHNLQSDFDFSRKIAEANKTENFKLQNLEVIVEELRAENSKFQERISELNQKIFEKDRDIGKLQHQVKHGVAFGSLSKSFNHNYSGPGGSISSGQLVSKIELATEAQTLLSQAHSSQLKWRQHSENLLRFTTRFLESMRQFQKAVHQHKKNQNDQQFNTQKLEFETNRKELQQCLDLVKKEIDDTNLDVIVQGANFGMRQPTKDDSLKKIQDPRTADNLNRIKNILDYQKSAQETQTIYRKSGTSKSASKTKLASAQPRTPGQVGKDTPPEGPSDIMEGGSLSNSKPTLTQALTHYRPQELIRLEQENEQLDNELKASKEFQKELTDRVDHLKKCIQENNQRVFISEKESERIKKMNEQLLREKVESEFKLNERIKQLEKEKDQLAQQQTDNGRQDEKERSKKVKFEPDEFEKEMQGVRNGVRESSILMDHSKRNTFHSSKPMSQIAAEGKRTHGDPFKTPDIMLVAQEDCADRQDKVEAKKADLLAEKEDVIMNLTIQKQKLKDIINEMEKQAVEYVEEITMLQKKVDKWQSNEVDHQELERLREEHTFMQDRCAMQAKQLDLLNKQLYNNDVQFDQLMAERIQLQTQSYDNLQRQFTQERAEFIRQTKLAQDLQSELSITNDRLKKLQREHQQVTIAKQDTEKALSQARDQVLGLNRDMSQLEFHQNRLKQFDQQIVENQDFIAKLQADLLRSQEQNKILSDKVKVIESLKDGEVGQKIQVYQQEILQITNQFQSEIADLKKQILAKDSELEYHKNSISMKADKHNNDLAQQREDMHRSQSAQEQAYKQEIQQLRSQKEKLQSEMNQRLQDAHFEQNQKIQAADDKFKRMEEDYMLQLRRQHDRIQQLEGKTLPDKIRLVPTEVGQDTEDGISMGPSGGQSRQGTKMKGSPSPGKQSEFKRESQQQQSQDQSAELEKLRAELEEKTKKLKATDLAFEQVVLGKNKFEKELYEVKKELEQSKERLIRAQADRKEENETIEDLREQLRISQSQIYENNEAHLKQIKALREKTDEIKVNTELDDLTTRLQTLQSQLHKQEFELKENEREIGQLRQFKKLYEGMKKDHYELEKRYEQLQSTSRVASNELNKQQDQIDKLHRDNQRLQSEISQLNESIDKKQQRLDDEIVQGAKTLQEKKDLEFKVFELERQMESGKQEQDMFVRLQNERVEEKKKAEQDKQDLQKGLTDLAAKLIVHQKELEVKENKIQELQRKVDEQQKKIDELQQQVDEFEKEKEDAFWDEKNSLDSGAKSDAKNKVGSEDLEKFHEFQKELERIYDEVQTNQENVQEKLNEFFTICPQIEEVKQTYAQDKFPLQSETIQKEFTDKYLQNNHIKLQKLFWLGEERYFVLQQEPSLDEKIQAKGKNENMPFLMAESKMDESTKAYLHSFVPQTETLADDPRLLDLMEMYDKQTSEFLEQLSLIKIDYQVFMNKVLAQSDDIDDIEQLEQEQMQQESNRLQKSNIELREHNQQYQLANVELRRRLEEVNSMLKELREAQKEPAARDDRSSINPNEQQISYGKNLSSLMGTESPVRDSNIPGQSMQSGTLSRKGSEDSEEKNVALEHVKSTVVMILKRMPIIDKMNEQVIPILYSLLNLTAPEMQEINEARAKLPIYKQDEKATKKAQKEAEKKSQQESSMGQAQISEASFGIESLPSEPGKDKKKGGFLDKFRKKKDDGAGDPNRTGSFEQDDMVSPPRDIMRKSESPGKK